MALPIHPHTRILLTGANGLLGQKLVRLCAQTEGVELLATARGPERLGGWVDGVKISYRSLDIESVDDWEAAMQAFRPDVVIHAAAMTQVDDCEKDPDLCRRLNVEAVRTGAAASNRHGAQFILVSTDFIFDGQAGPYDESAVPHPLSVYGNSKLDAERIVSELNTPWTIIRTVLVVGQVPGLSRSNIVLWAVGALSQGQTVNAVVDQWRSPTWAEDLAQGCLSAALRRATGIYHISGDEVLSIYDLVVRIARVYGLPESLVLPIDSESLAQPAKRPARTGFLIDKARRDLEYAPHSLEEVLCTFEV